MASGARDTVIYHNPRCSTSRKTLELLRDNGLEPTIVEYLKTPPPRADLAAKYVRMGARYVSTGTDLGFLLAACAAKAKEVQDMAT